MHLAMYMEIIFFLSLNYCWQYAGLTTYPTGQQIDIFFFSMIHSHLPFCRLFLWHGSVVSVPCLAWGGNCRWTFAFFVPDKWRYNARKRIKIFHKLTIHQINQPSYKAGISRRYITRPWFSYRVIFVKCKKLLSFHS